MSLNPDTPIIFFDIETTGTSVHKDRIVSLGTIKTDQSFRPIEEKSILINPTIPIPKEASDVHGITQDKIESSPTFEKYARSLSVYFNNCILAGYNSNNYDIPLLMEEFIRANVDPPKIIGQIDAYQIFIKRERRDLAAALKFYCNQTLEGAHDAINDIRATRKIVESQEFMHGLSLESMLEECTPKTLDYAGKFIRIDGAICYSFGKSKDSPVLNDRGFAIWMLRQDSFTLNTKSVLRKILSGEFV